MYPYNVNEPTGGETIIIDTQNHSIIVKYSDYTDPVNMAELPIGFKI